jgi:hypothetical protein
MEHISGGGYKKKKFEWTPQTEEILWECGEWAKTQTELPMKKALVKRFIEMLNENKITFVKSTVTESMLSTKLSILEKPQTAKEPKNIRWTQDRKQILIQCGLQAQAIHKRHPSIAYGTVLMERFCQQVPEYKGEVNNLRNQFNTFIEELALEDVQQLIDDIDFELAAEDIRIGCETTDNIPDDLSQILKWRETGLRLGREPLYRGMCYNCAQLLFGDPIRNGRWGTIRVEPGTRAPIEERYVPLNTTIPFKRSESEYNICRMCKQDAVAVLQEFNVLNPETKDMSIPAQLLALKDNELESIALLGNYHTIHTPPTVSGRKFMHYQGEMNLLSKQDKAYLKMLGMMREKAKPKEPVSTKRVREALQWLRKYNELYRKFYCNAETIFPYFVRHNPLLIGAHIDATAKGKDLSQELGDEDVGMFVPTEDYDANYNPDADEDFSMGQTHPKEMTDDEKEFRRLTKPGLKSPILEALAFPRDFPGGTGSYNPKGALKHRDWCKSAILNLDDRWRRNKYLTFYELNRYIKQSLLVHNRVVVAPVGIQAAEKPTAGDLRSNVYDRYGKKVPAIIPGSRSFWWTAQQELHAITAHMGRKPTYFITITTNDSWPEIQRIVRHGYTGETCDECPHEKGWGKEAINHAVECSIAFHLRWLEWKRAHLDGVGELGKVETYWWRREYQKRGAVHIHLAPWVDPKDERPNVVRAEMPRGGSDPVLRDLRELVRKLQIHNCRDDCFKVGKKKLKKCRFDFPDSLRPETIQKPDALRKFSVRRSINCGQLFPRV